MTKVIGISAFAARSGKDTLAKCLQIILAEKGKPSVIRSLATPLKDKTKDFIASEFGIDVFNCSDEEKNIIRPLLVAYGGGKRKQTKGKYWTRLMDEEIASLDKDSIVIVPDIRYCEYEGDEMEWLKSKGGKCFFVSLILENGERLPPPNEDEFRNGPLLEAAADYKIDWPYMSFEECLMFVRQNFNKYKDILE